MATKPGYGITADRDDRQAIGTGMRDNASHQPVCAAFAASRRRGLDMTDGKPGPFAAVVGKGDLAILGQFEAAELRIVSDVHGAHISNHNTGTAGPVALDQGLDQPCEQE